MDRGNRAYYELAFERDFLRKRGSAFQDFFADLMEKRYPNGDFIRVRPWGNIGDRKNDGYLKSQRTLFQVYAPNEMKLAEALKKIDGDFNGALPYWEQYFNMWIFVHNARDGLSPDITKRLLDLDQGHNSISVKSWGFEDLRRVLFELPEEDVAVLLGSAPDLKDYLSIGFEDLQAVLDFIKKQDPLAVPDLHQVPRDKVEINRLSRDTESLINAGRLKSASVGKFLKQYPDPEYGDQIVQAFKTKYDRLKNNGLSPDSIFRELQVYAGGELTREPKHQAAVLSVLAYLFDQCDIFESAGGHTA
ncbi:MAG: hypothetical protein H8E73_05545 [Planctomycetes bacterium]|nr:hypothetical protein [Planctomycetota bacterium]